MTRPEQPDHESVTDVQAPSRKKRIWTYGLVVVSVVALVVVAVGLLRPSSEPDLTTPPSTSASEAEPVAPTEQNVVEEPVDPTARIPGCDTVEAPGEASYTSGLSAGEQSYDNPKFPWFNGPKATAMSNAVAELLPSGAEVEFASPTTSLVFQPITDFGDSTPEPSGSTVASGSVVNGDAKGGVNIQVQQRSTPIPPCVAGSLDERRAMPDGVVVDIHDTWREVNGVRTISKTARAYATDGSWIYASANDRFGTKQEENSGQVPLTVDDLVRIASDRRLRVSTPVPPGTPSPSEGCVTAFGTDGPAVTREQARKLDAVLAMIDLGGQKLSPVQLGGMSNDTLCTGLSAATTNATLDISIIGGQPLPVEERPVPGSGSQKTLRTLDDGTVVQTDHSFQSDSSVGKPEESTMKTTYSVVVTRPAGTQISVNSSAATPDQVRPLSELESIALTPGLEL